MTALPLEKPVLPIACIKRTGAPCRCNKCDKPKKFSAFNDQHSEWLCYSDGTYVLSAELFPTKEEALAQLHKEFDEGYDMYAKDFTADDIGENLVRFCCRGADDGHGDSGCMWYLDATGTGSKPVWTFKPRRI